MVFWLITPSSHGTTRQHPQKNLLFPTAWWKASLSPEDHNLIFTTIRTSNHLDIQTAP
jgi:hypothetical protein